MTLDGALLRLDPDTGQAAAGNPFAGSPDASKRRIVAYGMRNPFRFTVPPGTGEVWVGDVGWGTWEEIDRVNPLQAGGTNLDWPATRALSARAATTARTSPRARASTRPRGRDPAVLLLPARHPGGGG